VTRPEAELVMSTAAALITYVVDHFDSIEPEVPF
jgi:hypothetical protein